MAISVIVVTVVFFAGMGVYALAAPARLIAPFDVELGSATARAEVRAVYGGFGLAVAAVLVLALADRELRPGIVLTVAAALAGMAVGRVVSAVADGATPFYPSGVYFFVEAAVAAALVAVL